MLFRVSCKNGVNLALMGVRNIECKASQKSIFIQPLRAIQLTPRNFNSSWSQFNIVKRQDKIQQVPLVISKRFKAAKADVQRSVINWRSAIVVVIFGTAVYLFMTKLKIDKEESIKRQKKQAVGKMAIGGPFELVDQDGKLRKSEDFLGKWMLIYFGFTHCPDICPEELEKMCRAVDLVDKVQERGAQLQPIFITIDPDRDDYKTVGKYIKDFSTRLVGLSGDQKQIDQVTKAYRVYYSTGPKDEDNDYIVDHTVIMYLVDDDGNFVDYFGQNKTAEEVATAIAIHMGSKESEKKK